MRACTVRAIDVIAAMQRNAAEVLAFCERAPGKAPMTRKEAQRVVTLLAQEHAAIAPYLYALEADRELLRAWGAKRRPHEPRKCACDQPFCKLARRACLRVH